METQKKQCHKKVDIRQYDHRVSITQDRFWLLLKHGHARMWKLTSKQTAEGVVPYENIYGEMKKQKSDINYNVFQSSYTKCALPLLPPFQPPPHFPPLPPLSQQPLLFLLLFSLLNVQATRMKISMTIHFYLKKYNHCAVYLIKLSVVFVFIWKYNNCMAVTVRHIFVSKSSSLLKYSSCRHWRNCVSAYYHR